MESNHPHQRGPSMSDDKPSVAHAPSHSEPSPLLSKHQQQQQQYDTHSLDNYHHRHHAEAMGVRGSGAGAPAGQQQHAPIVVPPGVSAVHQRAGSSGNTSTQFEYGHNPNAYLHHDAGESRLPAFGGEFQPGLFKAVDDRRFANPAPLGLSAFALTTFVLSAVNLGARGLKAPNIVVPLAFGYGGLVQLLAGMWEMAVGNTFGATALSSYGGFWIAYGVLLTPAWNITGEGGPYDAESVSSALGIFLTGWFIFTTILLLCTLRSTVMFFLLFFTLDMAFLMLACSEFALNTGATDAAHVLEQAGGGFGMIAAFLAWYNAFAGIADTSNSFFLIPVFHFPWSEKGRNARAAAAKTEREKV